MVDEKQDPIGDEFYRPLLRADYTADVLFVVSAALSIAALLVSRDRYLVANESVQIAFALSVVALFCTTLSIRLYFFPRAQIERYRDFVSHAFGKPLSHKRTNAYYNNSATTSAGRTAAQVLESCFFSKRILSRMAIAERIKIGVYVLIWLIAILNRSTDLAIISVAAQIVFSEQVVSRWFRLEWFRSQCEKIYDDVFRLFNGNAELELAAPEFTGRYEIVKATSGISLSVKIFDSDRETLNSEWEDVRKALGL